MKLDELDRKKTFLNMDRSLSGLSADRNSPNNRSTAVNFKPVRTSIAAVSIEEQHKNIRASLPKIPNKGVK